MSNYTKTTNFATKDALASGNPAKIVKGTEIDTEFNNIAVASGTKADKASPVFTGTVTLPVTNADSLSIGGDGVTVTGIKDEDDMASNSATKLASQQSIKAYVDSQVTAQDLDVTDGTTSISIDLDSEALSLLGGTGVTSTASGNGVTMAIDATVATLSGSQTLTNKTLATPAVTGALTTDGTIDGRDVAVDGTKLDGIESGATTDQTAAEIRALVEAATDSNVFTDADHTKLNGIEASADVTDTANVTAAGALMDSELTSIASVKALNQGVATTDSPDFAALNVNGTATMDGLAVTNTATTGTNQEVASFRTASGGGLVIRSSDLSAANPDSILEPFFGESLKVKTSGNDRFKVADNGDISFYEDTGTTAKLFWDASAERLGIGTSSPLSPLHIQGTDDVAVRIKATGANSLSRLLLQNDGRTWAIDNDGANGDALTFYDATAVAERMRITSTGNVGIGTSSPSASSANVSVLTLKDGASFYGYEGGGIGISGLSVNFDNIGNTAQYKASSKHVLQYTMTDTTGVHAWSSTASTGTAGATATLVERMRIDSSGNVGIGTNSPTETLDVRGSVKIGKSGTSPYLTFDEEPDSTSGSEFYLTHDISGNTLKFTDDASHDLIAMDRDTGNVGIGTSSPVSTLELANNNQAAGSTLSITNSFTGADWNTNDLIGTIDFRTDDTSTSQPVRGSIKSIVENTSGATSPAYTALSFSTASVNTLAERMRIDSAGNVGIGTDSPSALLDLKDTAPKIRLTDERSITWSGGETLGELEFYTTDESSPNGTKTASFIKSINTSSSTVPSGALVFGVSQGAGTSANATEAMRIDASGNVGIGTSSPSSPLHVRTTGSTEVLAQSTSENSANSGRFVAKENSSGGYGAGFRYDGDTNTASIFGITSNNDNDVMTWSRGGGDVQFKTSNTERMRIDANGKIFMNEGVPFAWTDGSLNVSADIYGDSSDNLVFRNTSAKTERMRIDASGNLLVGKTAADLTTTGIQLSSAGFISASRPDVSAVFNRRTTDGDIMLFRKDGTAVGNIGTVDGFPYISSNSNVGLKFLSSRIRPVNTDGSDRDGAIDLGATSARFEDIYATNGTIQTSDRNEKQDIAELSDAEQRVAVACKGLLRKFRWKDSVAEKGDEARTHFGIIAQDLQAAFAAEGLDAGDYAMFISTTWTDEETNEEKTRMGVRYSELLAFIIAAL